MELAAKEIAETLSEVTNCALHTRKRSFPKQRYWHRCWEYSERIHKNQGRTLPEESKKLLEELIDDTIHKLMEGIPIDPRILPRKVIVKMEEKRQREEKIREAT